jgi:hypothetical protein
MGLRSKNVRKKFSTSDARACTVGLGIMLAVILALAAATTSPTPAVAQGRIEGSIPPQQAQGGTLGIHIWHRVEHLSQLGDPSQAGQPYSVRVATYWALQNFQDCISPPVQRLERQQGYFGPGDYGPWELVWEGTTPSGLRVVQETLQTDKRYRYRVSTACYKRDDSGNLRVEFTFTDGVPFWMSVWQDDEPTPGSINYNGKWIASSYGFPSGGSTHNAVQFGATATYTYRGIAAAWVSTLDNEDDPVEARVACDRMLCGSVDTSSRTRGYRRVVWSGDWRTGNDNNIHRIQVIADNSQGDIDVDAFIIIREW